MSPRPMTKPIMDRILMDVDDALAGMTPRESFRWIEELIAELDARLDKARSEFHRELRKGVGLFTRPE